MPDSKQNRVKYSTYLDKEVVEAIRKLAFDKRVSSGYVIESMCRKVMPEKYLESIKGR